MSDLAGHDIRSHNSDVEELIIHVRNWLKAASNKDIYGGKEIVRRFRSFEQYLPIMCKEAKIEVDELIFNDYTQLISGWLSREE